MFNSRTILLLSSTIVLSSAATASEDVLYQVTKLEVTAAHDLCEQGVVSGSVPSGLIGGEAAVNLLDPTHGLPPGLMLLGSLGAPHGMTASATAMGINDDGMVTGWTTVEEFDHMGANPATRAFRWTPGSKMTALPTLGGMSAKAADVNIAGQVVGWSELDEMDAEGWPLQRATLWHPDGSMVNLGTFGGWRSRAYAVNDHGEVVGQAWYDDGDPHHSRIHQFLWLPQPAYGLPAGLHDIDPSNDIDLTSNARDINNNGQVVGRITEFAPNGSIRAKPSLWLPEPAFDLPSGMHDIGSLLPGGSSGFARGINDCGQIIGHSIGSFDGSFGVFHAFIWQEGIMRDLNDLLEPDADAFLHYAFAINNRGQIVGSGIVNGEYAAYLLTPIQTSTPGDLNGDGVVDVTDLLILLGSWGDCEDTCACPADFNGDGVVDASDLLLLLANWGTR